MDEKCRTCRSEPETVFYLLAGCNVFAKKTEYFVRHNALWKYIHFKILEAFSIPRGENWFVQSLRDVVLGNGVEVVCDQIIATDRPEGAHRPDIIVRDLNRKEVGGFGILHTNVEKKENEKISKYSGLKTELQRMMGTKFTVLFSAYCYWGP